MTAVQPPSVGSARFPDPFTFLDRIIREEGDPDGVLRALVDDGTFTITDWTPDEIQGLWGVVEVFLFAVEMLRTGVMLDPLQCPPDLVDRVALRRGIPQEVIDAARSSGAPDVDEARVRKLGRLAGLLLAWKGTRSGGGDGGLLRAIQSFARHRPLLRECFFWQSFTAVAGSPDPAQAIVGRDLTLFRDPEDFYIHDWWIVDYPVGSITVRAIIEALVELATPAGETVYLHWARWVDDFAVAGVEARDWQTDLKSGDTFEIVAPTVYQLAPGVSPYDPGGVAKITASSTSGHRWIYPLVADPQVVSTYEHDHWFDAILSLEETGAAATRYIDLEINWDDADDAAYRVRLSEDTSVTLYADDPGPATTSRGSATGCFPIGTLTADAVRLTVTIKRDASGPTKLVRVYVDGVLQIQYSDTSVLHNTTGLLRIGTDSTDCIVEIRRFLWQTYAAPTIVEP